MGLSPSPPGPKGHFLLGVLPEIQKDELDFLGRLVRDYGDVVKVRVVNHPAYVLSHPLDIERVLHTESGNFIKSVFLRESKALFGNGLLTSEGPFWLRQRLMLQPAFHHDHLLAHAEAMVDSTERMLSTWQDGQTRDAHADMTALTLEIIARVLFGDDMAADANEATQAFGVFFNQFDDRFGLYLIPEWLPTPNNLRYRKSIGRLDAIVERVIRKRRSNPATWRSGHDILSSLLATSEDSEHDADGGAGMTETQLRDEMMTLFFTGHETTGLALAWTWYLVGQNPEAEQKLFEEVDRVLGGRAPQPADLPQLRFTEMVVKESLRLYPPAYGVVREAVKDCEIGGYPIPAGATLAMFQWTVHRDPRYFERPNDFVPERWTPEFTRSLPRCAYFPFGAGPRVCIGNAFAMTETVLITAAIARKFQLQLVPGHPVTINPSLTLRPRKGVRVVLKRRS
ncbi:MAG TPA: cytochrome P450 [Terriglobia bacterium]|nr:cytochrome P450 [Terriglobia bacterium]